MNEAATFLRVHNYCVCHEYTGKSSTCRRRHVVTCRVTPLCSNGMRPWTHTRTHTHTHTQTLVTAIAATLLLYDVMPVPLPNTPAKTQPNPSIAMPSNNNKLLHYISLNYKYTVRLCTMARYKLIDWLIDWFTIMTASTNIIDLWRETSSKQNSTKLTFAFCRALASTHKTRFVYNPAELWAVS